MSETTSTAPINPLDAGTSDDVMVAPVTPRVVGAVGRFAFPDPLDESVTVRGYGIVVDEIEANEDRAGGLVIVPLPDPLGLVVPADAFTAES